MQNYRPYRPAHRKPAFWLLMALMLLCSPFIAGAVVFGIITIAIHNSHEHYPTAVPTQGAALTKTGKIGELVTFNNKKLLVSDLTQAQDYGRLAARPGNHLVAVNVTFSNITGDQLNLNLDNFYLKDDQWNAYAHLDNGATPALSNPLNSSLPVVSGWLTFEVPDKTSGLVLQYSDKVSGLDSTPVILEIKL